MFGKICWTFANSQVIGAVGLRRSLSSYSLRVLLFQKFSLCLVLITHQYMIRLLYLLQISHPWETSLSRTQHYTTGDVLKCEMVLMQVLQFGIGMSNNSFTSVEELLVQFK
ncbi:hypothetical protein SASPL_116050 [Salvia splendens]|uniref:Uncharacterized protein n=1 Tax=Salvia splendens TaxID=180675 RepID=A0A8X9A265_SALSN|nr:hypothetical protein SASPL_116050 [Salvia splendens]